MTSFNGKTLGSSSSSVAYGKAMKLYQRVATSPCKQPAGYCNQLRASRLSIKDLHLFFYLLKSKSNHVISHHLLTFCEIVDSTRIKSERTVGRKSNKSVDFDFLSGPPATCLYIPKLERWKRMNKPYNCKSLLPFSLQP